MRSRPLGISLVALGAAWALPAIAASAPAPVAVEAPVAAQDALSRMFAWWNGAMATPGGLTREGFAAHFTPDATLTINGVQVIPDLDGWVTHFRRIQASGAKVEIVVPFKTVFEAPGRIYTYHVIRSLREGKAACMLASGDATLRDGRISSITLVRIPLDEANGPWDKECWASSK